LREGREDALEPVAEDDDDDDEAATAELTRRARRHAKSEWSD
jgi:hypothetical protein